MTRRRRPVGRVRRGSLAVLAGLVVTLAVATPAWAATGRIDGVTASGNQLTFTFGATDAPEGQSIDPASVKVQVGGQDVAATAKPVTEAATPTLRRSILVMDTSGSMAGQPIVEAKKAANAYLAAVPKDVQVGLVSFADTARLLVPPTTTRSTVQAAIAGLQANGSTALYDGTILAVAAAGKQGLRNLLVLSDGADEGSKATLRQAVTAVRASGVTLDAVSLGTGTQAAALQALAAAGKGRVITTNQADELGAAFKQIANTVNSQVIVTAEIPADLAGTTSTVSATGTIGGQQVDATVAAPLPARTAAASSTVNPQDFAPQPVDVSGIQLPGWALWAALAALFVGIVGFVVFGFAGAEDTERGRVRRRLQRWSVGQRASEPAPVEATPTALGQSQVARSAVDLADRVATARGYDSELARRLDAGGIPLKPGEWVLIHFGIALGLALVMLLLSGFNLLAAVLGLAIGVLGPFLFLSAKESRRRKDFANALPDALQLLAGSLSAGYSLPQAADAVARESRGVMATELNRAIVEARLGVPLEEAFDEVAIRMRSNDFAWVVMAIRVQREVGGNLAEVLTNVAATMRERERLRRQVQSLSAEGRLSAVILGALPIVFALYLALVRPEYLSQLFTTPLGIVMVVVGVGLLLAGIAWLRKVVQVEV